MERNALRVALKKKLSHVKTVGFAGCSAAFFRAVQLSIIIVIPPAGNAMEVGF